MSLMIAYNNFVTFKLNIGKTISPYLSLSEEVRHEGSLDRVLEVSVGKDHQRGLPAELQGHAADANSTLIMMRKS